ncbi:MAG: anthranilate synthase component II [Desulfomonilia bacterium]|jgi:anthranilate synthase/aminodeoxychorismate synthase-like glutamine amidotransferase|uniref:Aminodeoxychorismate synthase, subunit II n=1 Tax=anaerobic digester metagenome TaxID=1263854 RepID=A0A485M2V6_9ZZZZ|nr:aminodeoxychorismate/anthranilate synthase component II [Pseudomonadota bacterium]HPD22163.1 aminodeoxychorismate/anthranilate synthase component II [Deltaproteobacteria bacterium]HPX17847.1 aminodeoxychorismate/anthranilate synthase component II [Deltaproteobacteria bacterium]HRS55990.1 aminodeoxychorismate/anthranilate synthase component II [Desulfomonilia bacterium]HRV35584.1 aminodeoxychorismate/anthranilate synthase component II [Desulfomonilia bacterium]
MILMIDNFDSFTYNLVQGFEILGQEVAVYRNDAVSLDEIQEMAPSGIIISPGPGTPGSAGISVEVVRKFHTSIPILGVCLGHQCIGEAFGANIIHAGRVMHGKSSRITHDGCDLFTDIPQGFDAVRYHSLVVDEKTLPGAFLVCARSEDNEVMGMRLKHYPVFGVQFHPESIATEHGHRLMGNFIAQTKEVV